MSTDMFRTLDEADVRGKRVLVRVFATVAISRRSQQRCGEIATLSRIRTATSGSGLTRDVLYVRIIGC
jgi:hypothetical protein